MDLVYKIYIIWIILMLLAAGFAKYIYFPTHPYESQKVSYGGINQANWFTKLLIYFIGLSLIFEIVIGAVLLIIYIIHL